MEGNGIGRCAREDNKVDDDEDEDDDDDDDALTPPSRGICSKLDSPAATPPPPLDADDERSCGPGVGWLRGGLKGVTLPNGDMGGPEDDDEEKEEEEEVEEGDGVVVDARRDGSLIGVTVLPPPLLDEPLRASALPRPVGDIRDDDADDAGEGFSRSEETLPPPRAIAGRLTAGCC